MRRQAVATLLGIIVALASCSSEEDTFKRKNASSSGADDPNNPDPNVPKCTETGKPYVGFAATALHDGRVNAKIGADRARIKPYSALRGEYNRTIGVVPDSLETAGASFGNPPEHFMSEPRASAIQLFSAYRVAFDGCLTFVDTKAEFAKVPDEGSAKTQCAALARKFWSRAPSDDELQACSDIALKDSAAETDPKRRWAYTCATLLSSAPFLTY